MRRGKAVVANVTETTVTHVIENPTGGKGCAAWTRCSIPTEMNVGVLTADLMDIT